MILFKKQLFDLEFKGQGPMKVNTVRNIPPYVHAPTYEISLTYLERQKSYDLDKLRWEKAENAEEAEGVEVEEKIRLKQRSIRYVTHHLMVMHPHTNYHWPISKEKNVMAQKRKYYLKNNYLTLSRGFKVDRYPVLLPVWDRV